MSPTTNERVSTVTRSFVSRAAILWGSTVLFVCMDALTHMLGISNTEPLCTLYTQLPKVLVLLGILTTSEPLMIIMLSHSFQQPSTVTPTLYSHQPTYIYCLTLHFRAKKKTKKAEAQAPTAWPLFFFPTFHSDIQYIHAHTSRERERSHILSKA